MPIKKADKYQVNENKRWFKKWWPEGVAQNLNFEEITMAEMLDRTVEKYPNKNFLWFLETWVTYKEFRQYVLKFATGLSKLGVKKGDVVAILTGNCLQYIVTYHACMRLGAVATGINPTYQPMEILHQFDICKPSVLISYDLFLDEKVAKKESRPYVGGILPKSTVKKVIYTNIADLARGLGIKKVFNKLVGRIPKGKVKIPGAIKFMDVLNNPPNVPEVEIDVKTHPATYIMTGGTTGLPKAAVLTHFNCVSNAYQCLAWLGSERPGIGNVGILPFFHSFAHTIIMNATIPIGGWIMIFPKPPSQDELCALIERLPCPEGLIYAGAELLFKRLAEFRDIKNYPGVMGKLILCISGAGPLHRPVRDAFVRNTGGNIVEGYGLTETGPAVSAGNLFGESPIGVIGMPFPGTEWGIFPTDDFTKGPICMGDPGDTNFGEDHSGEICIHGPQVMLEYLDKPDETAETIMEFDGNLWLLTGDIGFLNEDGTIEIRDRKKQLIKFKGYSIYPKEVEELLMKHDNISEAAVAGLPHDEFGEIVKAWVELTAGSTLSPEAIKEWARENITHYKRPGLVEIIKEVPKNILGKVQRRILQVNDPIWLEKQGKK